MISFYKRQRGKSYNRTIFNNSFYQDKMVVTKLFICFRLIVIAEKDVVYQRFPIPLINRLEKHLIVMSTALTEHQSRLVKELENWVQLFSEAKPQYSSAERWDCYCLYVIEAIQYNIGLRI